VMAFELLLLQCDPVVELTAGESALPPVSSTLSNKVLLASRPINTRPVPKAVHVPKPNKVAGLVATAACVYK